MKFLIWNFERDMWWRPNNCGYTPNIDEAGRYSFARAKAIVDRANILMALSGFSRPKEAMLPDPVPMEDSDG